MSEFYEKMLKAIKKNRDDLKSSNPTSFEARENVLKKLLIITFFNEESPGELPETFLLEEVMLFQNQLEQLLESTELDVTVKKVGHSYPGGFIYCIKAQGN